MKKIKEIIQSVISKEFADEIASIDYNAIISYVILEHSYLFQRYNIDELEEESDEYNELYSCITGAIDMRLTTNI